MADFDPQTLQSIKSAVTPNAPGLATLLDGPNAGVAIAALAKALAGDAQASASDVLAALRAGGAAVTPRITEAEQEAQSRLHQQGSSLAALAPDVAKELISAGADIQSKILEDTSDARKRQIELHDKTNAILAYVVTAAFFSLLVLLIFFGDKFTKDGGGARDLLFTLLGVLGTGWASIIGFYFGSSAGSLQKTQALTASALIQSSSSASQSS